MSRPYNVLKWYCARERYASGINEDPCPVEIKTSSVKAMSFIADCVVTLALLE